ncbi:MAG: hypothetical protein ACXVY5_00720 [Gaiellales bacterium]
MPAPLAPIGQLRAQKMRELAAAPLWRIAMVAFPLALGGVFATLSSSTGTGAARPVAVFVLVAAVAALVGLAVTWAVANSRAKSAFLEAWALSRGWKDASGLLIEEATPLLRNGDRRHSEHYFAGKLANDPAVICHYTYEVRHTSTDSRGATTETWEDHPFTLVQVAVTANGIPRLSMHPRAFLDNRLFDRIDSAVTSDRVVELESAQLEKRYKLEVADEADDMAVHVLFEPSFMMWCLDQADQKMLLEIEHDTLVVAVPGRSYDPGTLDGLLDKTTTVAARLAESQRPATRKET